MKTGTTWLNSLVYCIMETKINDINEDPLSKNHPGFNMQTLEINNFEILVILVLKWSPKFGGPF